jgi:hypothetical protein
VRLVRGAVLAYGCYSLDLDTPSVRSYGKRTLFSKPTRPNCHSRSQKPPDLGSTPRSWWMVLASNPVASLIRFAARPVGAHKA